LPGIVSCEPGKAGINRRIIAESERERSAVRALRMGGTAEAGM